MKFLLLLTLALAGCADVKVTHYTDGRIEIHTRTLFKDIEDASAQTEEMVLELGSSRSGDTKAIMAVCILYPQLPACQNQE